MLAGTRDDQTSEKGIFCAKAGDRKISLFLLPQQSHKFWDDKETTATPHQLSPVCGIDTLSTSGPQKPRFGRILSPPICRICLEPFQFHILEHFLSPQYLKR